ncbi:uncharacterized protein LOC111996653 [Quercus suber]|uniref:uncharacterized protein LOC111996653 n=1 Tax=Quercus suber TaxID=58331 RepID=UPI0032DF11AF
MANALHPTVAARCTCALNACKFGVVLPLNDNSQDAGLDLLIMKKSTTIFDFFKRKVSNDLEANISGATLPTTNVEENPDVPAEENPNVPIEENLDVPIEENPEPVEENLDVPIKQNSQTKFQKPTGHDGQNAFTVNGFKSWKKVRNGESCSFSLHMGKDLNSTHRIAHKACLDLMNQSQHIDRVVSNFTSEQIANNRVRLKASIDVVRHLALQAIAFRGRDESSTSTNRGNFLTTLDLMVGYNNNIVEIMAKAPKNATYTSPQIQKEILHVISTKVKKAIKEEIGDAKFCILVDEARDESMKEQMAVVLRYVDTNGFVRERFYGIVHVIDTAAVTLKKEIYHLFSNYCLDIQNIRGQGYDGASNMRGEWNGLQALILNDCPYAYYIHCFAHRLQLALVGASKAVVPLNRFFTKLILVINNIRASCKRIEQLKIARASDIAYLIDIEELETGKGLNQMVTLQRPGDTR